MKEMQNAMHGWATDKVINCILFNLTGKWCLLEDANVPQDNNNKSHDSAKFCCHIFQSKTGSNL